MAKKLEPRYLGDNVHVSVDEAGTQLAIAEGNHENTVIYLNKEVLEYLFDYAVEAKILKKLPCT